MAEVYDLKSVNKQGLRSSTISFSHSFYTFGGLRFGNTIKTEVADPSDLKKFNIPYITEGYDLKKLKDKEWRRATISFSHRFSTFGGLRFLGC